MTGEKHMFQTLNLKEEGNVGFGGGQKGRIIGTSTIGNSQTIINKVWLVDGLKHNLLSISQLCDTGYEVVFNKDFCSVINSDKTIVFKGKRKGNVYKINLSELTDQKVICLMTVSDENKNCSTHFLFWF